MSGITIDPSRAARAAEPGRGPGPSRIVPALVLLLVAALLVVAACWAALVPAPTDETTRLGAEAALAVPPGPAAVGAEVPVPGGFARVERVDHVEPAALGRELPVGTHAVEVGLVAASSAGTQVHLDAASISLRGNGIDASLLPERVTSPVERPDGGGTSWTLVYAVPDASTNLTLALPGGSVVSAEHADHPGAAHTG